MTMLAQQCFGMEDSGVHSAFIVGWGSHIVIDMVTHGGPNFVHLNPSYAWPSSLKLSQWLGFWEYRYATHLVIEQGFFGVKPFEVVLCGVLATFVIKGWKSSRSRNQCQELKTLSD